MKKIIILSVLFLMFFLTSCEYDNYDEPSIVISGKLLNNGENFLYDGNPTRSVLKVIQKGFGKVDNGITIRIDEQGEFRQLLFPGEYWLTLNNNAYPFEIPDFKSLGAGLGYDSIYINLKKSVDMKFEVKPYFNITDFTGQVEGNNLVLRANVTKNTDTSEPAPRVIFCRGYASTGIMVNGASTCSKAVRAIIPEEGSIEVSLPIFDGITSYRGAYTNNFREHAYCRVSIELEGIQNYYLFSNIIKVENVPLTPQ